MADQTFTTAVAQNLRTNEFTRVNHDFYIDGAGAITNSLNATGTTTIDETGKASRFFRLQATEE